MKELAIASIKELKEYCEKHDIKIPQGKSNRKQPYINAISSLSSRSIKGEISAVANLWTDSCGNTIHVCKITINNEQYYSSPTCGSGAEYLNTAVRILNEFGYAVKQSSYIDSCQSITVNRKKDLLVF